MTNATMPAILDKSLEVASIGDYVESHTGFTCTTVWIVTGIEKNQWGGYLIVKNCEGEQDSVPKFLDKETKRNANGSSIGWLYIGPDLKPAD